VRRDASAGILERRAVAQPNQRQKLIQLAVAVDRERPPAQRRQRDRFLGDDRREDDAHRRSVLGDFSPSPWIDMLRTCRHATRMSKMIQIRNVPDAVHRKIKVRAAQSGMTLSDYLLDEIERLAALPTREEMLAR